MKGKKAQKAEVVASLLGQVQKSHALVLADYRGISVADMSQLRSQLKETGAELKVVKNTLMRRAVTQAGADSLVPLIEGPVAVTFIQGDPVGPAKVLVNFSRTRRLLQIKGGYLAGRVIGADDVRSLAELPPRDVLLARVVSGMKAPLNRLVSALSGPITGLVYSLEAIRKAKLNET